MRRLRISLLVLHDDGVSLITISFFVLLLLLLLFFFSLHFVRYAMLHRTVEYVNDRKLFPWTVSVSFSLQVAVWFIILLVIFLLVFPVGSAVCTYVRRDQKKFEIPGQPLSGIGAGGRIFSFFL